MHSCARLLPTTVPEESIAFLANFSSTFPASAAGCHNLTFDTVITNVGNAYHPHSGSFIAPRTGLYVFIWTIRVWGDRYSTQQVVNDNIINEIYLNPVSTIDGSFTGTVVVHVNQGDDVLIRTGSVSNKGDIISDFEGRSPFAGWILMWKK